MNASIQAPGNVRFPWPAVPGSSDAPVWNGAEFVVGATKTSILSYETGASGWTDDLTAFHEDNAGSDHVMDRSSRRHAMEQLQRHLKPAPKDAVVLEVGCSSGFMLQTIRENMPDCFLIGADYVLGPLKHLAQHRKDVPLMQFDMTKCPLPDQCVDAVLLINVLEHIKEDAEAMRQVARILRPGGIAVIEVPAGAHLYDVYDKQLMHFRRYSMRALKQIVEPNNLKVLETSHLGFSIYAPFYYTKKKNQKHLNLSDAEQQKIVSENIRASKSNFILNTLMGIEMGIGRFINYPCGIRCLLTCQKPAA